LERTNWPSGASVIEWRRITIAATVRLVGHDK